MTKNAVCNLQSDAAIDFWVEWNCTTTYVGAMPWERRTAMHAAVIFLLAANTMGERMLPAASLHYQILEG